MKRASVYLFLVGYLLLLAFLVMLPATPGLGQVDSTVLKVMLENGHGSGVHIGNGYILTAGHVILDQSPNPRIEADIKLKTRTGERFGAEVLWFNRDYDIALMRSYSVSPFAAVELVCSEVDIRWFDGCSGLTRKLLGGFFASPMAHVGRSWVAVAPENALYGLL